ncbi:MAG: Lrp/AsnC family transcriptional regulator [Candidatus Altiarchaeales archaeon]|nr:Lrp/AsnC family transcriptional regulator [Candidatus Altiarchaeales archaeon]
MEPNLTKNDKIVLKELINNGRISDTSVAKKIGISVQAVRKIRKKFENNGIIKRYSTTIDYEKIGIRAFAIVQLKITEKGSEAKMDLFESPNIIGSFKLPETNITNIFIAGFSTLEELDKYFAKTKEKYLGLIEIQKINVFSNIGLMKNSPIDLLTKKVEEYNNKNKPFNSSH